MSTPRLTQAGRSGMILTTLGRASGALFTFYNQATQFSASARRAYSPQSSVPAGADLLSGPQDAQPEMPLRVLAAPQGRGEQDQPVRDDKLTTKQITCAKRAELSAIAGGPACRVSGGKD